MSLPAAWEVQNFEGSKVELSRKMVFRYCSRCLPPQGVKTRISKLGRHQCTNCGNTARVDEELIVFIAE